MQGRPSEAFALKTRSSESRKQKLRQPGVRSANFPRNEVDALRRFKALMKKNAGKLSFVAYSE
jgi:hypothetical protein